MSARAQVVPYDEWEVERNNRLRARALEIIEHDEPLHLCVSCENEQLDKDNHCDACGLPLAFEAHAVLFIAAHKS